MKRQDPEWVKRENEKQAARARLPEVKARMRAAHKRRWANKEYREKVLAQNKGWYKNHPDANRANALRWRNRNRERARASARAWFKAHPERRQEYDHKKRARKLAVTVNPKSIRLFISGTKAKKFAKCYYCQRTVSTKNIHFDHILALARGGAHSVENLCVACSKCNQSKHAKRLADFVKLGQQLLEL